jgi:hypothetical protein
MSHIPPHPGHTKPAYILLHLTSDNLPVLFPLRQLERYDVPTVALLSVAGGRSVTLSDLNVADCSRGKIDGQARWKPPWRHS